MPAPTDEEIEAALAASAEPGPLAPSPKSPSDAEIEAALHAEFSGRPDPSALDSARRGFETSATFGARDKLAAVAGMMGEGYQRGQDHPHTLAEVNAYAASHPSKAQPGLLRRALGLGPEPMDITEAQASLDAEKGLPSGEQVYQQGLGEEEAKTKTAQAAHPWAYGAGSVAGGVLASALPGARLFSGAGGTVGQRVLNSGLSGGVVGALTGAGESHADNLKDLAGDVAGGAAVGTAMGGVGQGIGEGAKVVGRALTPLARSAWELAGEKAFKAIGGIQSDIKSALKGSGVIGGLERVIQAGNDLRDLGIATPLVTPKGALERIAASKQKIGSELGSVLPDLDKRIAAAGKAGDPSVSFDVDDVVGRIQKEVIDPLRQSRVTANQSIADQVEKQALDLMSIAPQGGSTAPLSRAHQFRHDFDNTLFFNSKDPSQAHASSEMKKIRDIVNQELDQKINASANAVGTGTEGDSWRTLNRLYSSLKIGERAAEHGALRKAGNSSFSLRAAQLAASGMAGALGSGHSLSGAALAAGVAGGGAKLLEHFGPGLQMGAAGLASRALGSQTPVLEPLIRAGLPAAIQYATPSAATLAMIAALRGKPEQDEDALNMLKALPQEPQNGP